MFFRRKDFAVLVGLFICAQLPIMAQDEEQQLKQLLQELASLNKAVEKFEKERDGIQSDLKQQELKLSRLHKKRHETELQISIGKTRLVELESQMTELQASKVEQEGRLKSDIQTMYRSGSEEPLKMLLNQNNPAEVSRMFRYYEYLLEARAQSIQSYFDTINLIDTSQRDLSQQQLQLTSLSRDLKSQEIELTEARKVRLALLEKLDSRILSAQEEIEEKERDRARLEELIDEVEERIASLAPPASFRPFAELKGKYSWPARGNFIHKYNARKNGSLRWQGVVIKSDPGEPVTTIHHGRVVFADFLRGYGLIVIVDHDDDYLSLYGHNQSLFVEPGDWVAPGDKIALVGNSGGISESGLYFEIRHKGKPQNPSGWARK